MAEGEDGEDGKLAALPRRCLQGRKRRWLLLPRGGRRSIEKACCAEYEGHACALRASVTSVHQNLTAPEWRRIGHDASVEVPIAAMSSG
ncbi:MAG: hypothetical protein LDL44_09770 [Caenispirillum sp.]|nr:hypothetical protein [Caenispirillum sp.]